MSLLLGPLVALLIAIAFWEFSLVELAILTGIAGALSSIGLYFSLGLIHDGAHGNIPKTARLAQLINLYAMPTLGVSTFTYRKAHMAHHSYLGWPDKDPQYAPFERKQGDLELPNYLITGGQVLKPLSHFRSIFREMGQVFQRRDQALVRSLYSKTWKKLLYVKYSFMGGSRTGLGDDFIRLPSRYVGPQKKLDLVRLAGQATLIGMLFLDPYRWIAIALFLAIAIAAFFNVLRTTFEHSGEENTGDVSDFNQHHSSNTAGSNLFSRFLWFPVPWHALHHAAPRVPFFLLATLNDRVQKKLADEEPVAEEAAKTENRQVVTFPLNSVDGRSQTMSL